MKELRKEIEKLKTVVNWGFPEEYWGRQEVLEGYTRGKDDVWKGLEAHLSGFIRKYALEMIGEDEKFGVKNEFGVLIDHWLIPYRNVLKQEIRERIKESV